ncbi:MAG: hypothetical protein GW906_01195 [Epsilonproteobacteria bacterium]|nr:hypothetical protein [Campylobacterota bacterium]OIO16256.1 MAG: hypothetical protein AUJ81_04920 [Helicobacteraceae bacterium CG1_02_36_14]PIP09450.1 MAG: hypothetical protein COX50_11080 [Sulfurimonas sp. CG23_combo_of_CG06-09_8_20_14_all_36_33]PIS24573.1 MAG: hypothetical protein COT46_09030 [Sulfurimonas sp. CG08_land_8_20_14_0_20_36_33]PIU35778.1 MAG: hypothetical protein COT05_02095 [Sulfurimonas sp. CG07_land_8_20_14_0_80_36_56]PIV05055.1 MAG: hypothetical protein COS56_03015 [Sulfur
MTAIPKNMGVPMSNIITEEMSQLQRMIMETVAKREILKKEMHDWYENHSNEKFQGLRDLILTDGVLSELDSNYKRLWDIHNARNSIRA